MFLAPPSLFLTQALALQLQLAYLRQGIKAVVVSESVVMDEYTRDRLKKENWKLIKVAG